MRGFDDFESNFANGKFIFTMMISHMFHCFVLGSGCTPDVVFDAANVNVGEFKLN